MPSVEINGASLTQSLPLRGEPQSGDEFCNAKHRGGPRSGNVCVSKLAIERSEICGRSFDTLGCTICRDREKLYVYSCC